jgi:hypothetical protein
VAVVTLAAMFHKPVSFVAGVLLALTSGLPLGAADGVKITEQSDRLVIDINGKPFTEYRFAGAPHVYFYPLLGPGGTPMTRDFPMKNVPGEDQDHKHHRSLWFSHGAVNGVDFWSEEAKAGKIVHDKFLEVKSGDKAGVIRSANKWIAPNGEVVCTDELTFRVLATPDNERLFDFEITLFAPPDKAVVLGDTKEGSMAIRVAETMRLKPNKQNTGKPGGEIVQSTGVKGDKTWGKRAEWCDYSGPVGGKTLGVAIFDNPSNPRYPTWWHVRDYGLFAANPFGQHDFEKKPAGTGDLTIPAGKSVTFKYRFYLHEGDEQQAAVAERFEKYVAGQK